tara:strand:- start:399 stop:1850 length:1452 start_codon:yes stop_codon:yes gene_type:complete
MTLGLGSIDRDISRRERMLAGDSAGELQRKAALSKGLVELLATQMALTKRQSAENQVNMLMGANPDSIKAQKESELVGQSLADVTRQTAGILGQRKRTMNQNMQAMAKLDPRMLKALSSRRRGLAAAPVPKVQTAAQGGIVGYANGNEVQNNRSVMETLTTPVSNEDFLGFVDYVKNMGIPLTESNVGDLFEAYKQSFKEAPISTLASTALVYPGLGLAGAGIKGLAKLGRKLIPKKAPPLSATSTAVGTAGLLSLPQDDSTVPPGTDEAAREAFRTARDFAPDAGKKEIDSPGKPPGPVKTGDSAATRASKARAYDEWLQGVITVLTAPGGLQNMGRAYVQHTQRVLDNNMGMIGLQIQRDKVAAMNAANKLKSTELTSNNLIRRINDIDKILQDINADVMNSPIGISYEVAKQDFIKKPSDKNRSALAVAEGLVQQAITQRANSMGTDMGFGGAGLLGQKAFLIDQLNAMDFDMTRQPKQS